MRTLTDFRILGGVAALSLLLACGGGSSDSAASAPPAATSLSYTNPSTSASNWTLVKDPASTSTHLVLDLVPPADGKSGFGVGFTLNATGGVTWSKVASTDTELVSNKAYALGSGSKLMKGVANASGDLLVGVFQKGLSTTPVAHATGAVAQVAMDLTAGTTPGTVTLTVKAAQELQTGGMTNITITSGTIARQ